MEKQRDAAGNLQITLDAAKKGIVAVPCRAGSVYAFAASPYFPSRNSRSARWSGVNHSSGRRAGPNTANRTTAAARATPAMIAATRFTKHLPPAPPSPAGTRTN